MRVNSQLKSHKRFANAFPNYCQLVDHARLYCTNGIGAPPTVSSKNLLLIVEFSIEFKSFKLHIARLFGTPDSTIITYE